MNFGFTIRHLLPAALLLAASIVSGRAGEVDGIPQVGPHQPILTVEKNVNPQNKMVVFTKADAKGRFLKNPDDQSKPMLDFYWLMDGRNYKPVNSLIKTEIRRRFDCQWGTNGQPAQFSVDINDLKEVKTDIKDLKMDVYATETDGGAVNVEAQMSLGPSDGNMRIKLSSIYTEGRAFPPAVYSVTLKGEELVNGAPTGKQVARKYLAKN